MQYEVPFLSQYADVQDAEWKHRGCGIVALKMVLDYWHHMNSSYQTDGLDVLMQRGIQGQAYKEGIGWTHRGLVELAQSYGYEGNSFDYAEKGPTPKSAEEALSLLEKNLEKGPVLASIFRSFDPQQGGGHIVVITGLEEDAVMLNDPEEESIEQGQKQVPRQVFLEGFKRRFIVIHPVS